MVYLILTAILIIISLIIIVIWEEIRFRKKNKELEELEEYNNRRLDEYLNKKSQS